MKQIIILGSPNVGKTSVFNFLCKKNNIVSEIPGSTRDWQEGYSYDCRVIDTPGCEKFDHLNELIFSSDEILFVVDGTHYVEENIIQKLNVLRKFQKKITILINKSRENEMFFCSLGIDFYFLSKSMKEIDFFRKDKLVDRKSDIKIAIIGKQNVGKSSLINKLVGKNRLLVRDEFGTSTDSTCVLHQYKNLLIEWIDTPGFDFSSSFSRLCMDSMKKAISQADLIVTLLHSFEKNLLRKIHSLNMNKVPHLIVLTKSDLLTLDQVKVLQKDLIFLGFSKPIAFSIFKDRNIKSLLSEIENIFHQMRNKISTQFLNKWIRALPGEEIKKIKYICQIREMPKVFKIFSSVPLSSNKTKYLKNRIQKDFNLKFFPIEIISGGHNRT